MPLHFVAVNGAVLRATTVLVKHKGGKNTPLTLTYSLCCDWTQKPISWPLHPVVNRDKTQDVLTHLKAITSDYQLVLEIDIWHDFLIRNRARNRGIFKAGLCYPALLVIFPQTSRLSEICSKKKRKEKKSREETRRIRLDWLASTSNSRCSVKKTSVLAQLIFSHFYRGEKYLAFLHFLLLTGTKQSYNSQLIGVRCDDKNVFRNVSRIYIEVHWK